MHIWQTQSFLKQIDAFMCLQYKSFIPLLHTHFDASTKSAFENIVGKGEIARNKQFLLFPQCFLLNQIIVSPFVYIFDMISLFAPELEEPKLA